MDSPARMIDANWNRAREALRVMEDAARFALDDAGLCAELKGIRHGLRDAIGAAGVDRGVLLANRDTPGDVGTRITTASEGERAGLAGVVAAAGARLGEALRVIEECLKVRGTDMLRRGDGPGGFGSQRPAERVGGTVEALRYRAYEAERRVVLALGTGRARQWRLCVLISQNLCRRSWEDVARAAVAGGADCLQLREKELDDGELLARARRLREIAEGRAAVVINDRPDIALLAGADGVHLGQTDMSVADVRRLAGFGLLIGVSTENLDQARAAVGDGADYCGVGPMFGTATKEKQRLAGPGYLREYLADPATRERPHLAIGGITPRNVGELREAGCRGVAVSSAVCEADDPGAVCRALIDGLGGERDRASAVRVPGVSLAEPRSTPASVD
ncbi:MAG: thiamine phosphate synthase [Phycisphaerales bacterium]